MNIYVNIYLKAFLYKFYALFFRCRFHIFCFKPFYFFLGKLLLPLLLYICIATKLHSEVKSIMDE